MKIWEFQQWNKLKKEKEKETTPYKTEQSSHAALFILLITVIHFLFM